MADLEAIRNVVKQAVIKVAKAAVLPMTQASEESILPTAGTIEGTLEYQEDQEWVDPPLASIQLSIKRKIYRAEALWNGDNKHFSCKILGKKKSSDGKILARQRRVTIHT